MSEIDNRITESVGANTETATKELLLKNNFSLKNALKTFFVRRDGKLYKRVSI